MAKTSGGSGAFFLGFIAGLVAGAAAGIFTAPRSGRDTIDQFCQRGQALKTRATEFGAQTRDRAADQVQRVQQQVQLRLDETLGAGQEAAQQARQETQTIAEEAYASLDAAGGEFQA